MDIHWPPFPSEPGLLDHPATEEDIAAGRAAFVLRDNSGQLVGAAAPMGMARLGFAKVDDDRHLGVAVQVEAASGQIMVGLLQEGGTFSIISAAEFEEAPRMLVFYRKPGYGLPQLEKRLARGFTVDRKGNALAYHYEDGPVFFVRHADGEVVNDEIALLDNNPNSMGLAASCDSLFEVSFLDLDQALDEINSLIISQEAFQEEVGGYLYLSWNERLTLLGEE